MKQPKTNPDSLIENYLPADYYATLLKKSRITRTSSPLTSSQI
ncbi:hypothetical protein NXW10_19750 [Bacteroides fragilis]|nr:hypothetical protein NXW10_19750 [Bacteroides fragilis]